MRVRRLPVVMIVAMAIFGLWSTAMANFPNIFYFTQKQDATTTSGKLTLTYSPQLTETPQAGPYLLSADVTWINNTHGQSCNTMAMTHVSANTFTYAIDAIQGDTIDYFFTQHWVGQPQSFYAWIPSHQCTNTTDTKWFTYVMGQGFEPMPKWPLVIEGSERYRNRHEDEWRFDHFSGNYFQSTALNYKLADWGDSLLVVLFPSEATNWSNGRFFGMSGYDTLCDHDTYSDNQGSGDASIDGTGFMGPANIPYFGQTVEPFQATWTNTQFPQIRWYVWMIRDLSYGQYIDYELSAARSLSDGQLYYSEPQRYYIGLGKISHKFQHPWANPAGDASINTVTFPEFAFSQHVQNAGPGRSSDFMKGKALFDTDWGTGMVYNYATPFDCNGSPNSFPDTTHSPFFKPTMRGPIYRKAACFVCHFEDGKGYPDDMVGSDPNIKHGLFTPFEVVNPDGSLGGHPVFGGSLETSATPPAVPQGQLNVTWDSVPGQYADGTPFMLRKPHYSFSNLGWGVTSIDLSKVRISPRYIINLTGLGMLEAIDESTILSFVDLPGKAGTGIAGKANRVDDGFTGPSSLGRFGWKADVANLKTEVYASVAGDVGVSNMYFANEPYMTDNANPPEMSVPVMDTLRTYISLLAPPPRQLGKGYIIFDPSIANATEGGAIWLSGNLYKGQAFEEIWTDPSAIRGKALFADAKCDLCHIPAIRTGTKTDFNELKNLEIQPFTDMLIHDMGPEESDTGGATNGYVSGLAGPSDWRTSPLWGELYYTYSNKVALLMHDGRARGIAEAILWHFGEGTYSRNKFINMTAQQRADLIRYTQLPFADRLAKNAMSTAVRGVQGAALVKAGAIPSLMCYPNPIRSVATLRLQNIVGTRGDRIVVSIYNMQGKRVFSQVLGLGQSAVTWNTSRCGAGKYFATVQAEGRLYKKDLLVMK
jgi:CxxC motif-containing protein (DUF1111 family)